MKIPKEATIVRDHMYLSTGYNLQLHTTYNGAENYGIHISS